MTDRNRTRTTALPRSSPSSRRLESRPPLHGLQPSPLHHGVGNVTAEGCGRGGPLRTGVGQHGSFSPPASTVLTHCQSCRQSYEYLLALTKGKSEVEIQSSILADPKNADICRGLLFAMLADPDSSDRVGKNRLCPIFLPDNGFLVISSSSQYDH
jgi:hypothetical protein